MSIGYTDCIKNGVSFKEYALGCARTFGALYYLRDELLIHDEPKKRVACSFYTENINKSQTELDKIKKLTDDIVYGEKEINRVNKSNEWIDMFIDSLKEYE